MHKNKANEKYCLTPNQPAVKSSVKIPPCSTADVRPKKKLPKAEKDSIVISNW